MSTHERTVACGRVDHEFTADDLPERARHLVGYLRRAYSDGVEIHVIWDDINAQLDILLPVTGRTADGGRFFSRANIELQRITRDTLEAILDDCCHDCNLNAMRCSRSYRRFYQKIREADDTNIVGYLGRDPEIRYTPQGTAVCNVSVATTERRKNVAGDYEDHTTWFRVTLWNRQAELANEYLAKGRLVYIEGRLRQEEYTDREGNRRVSLEVTATEMQFLGRREDSEHPASANAGLVYTEEAEGVAKPAPNGSGKSGKKGSKRIAKEMVSVEDGIEDNEVPF